RDHFRDRQANPEPAGGSEAVQFFRELPEQEPPDSESGASGSLLHRALELIRGDFEERTWQAFWRSTVDGRPASDIAADLGTTVDAVYQAKARVLRRLREEMRDLVGPPATGTAGGG